MIGVERGCGAATSAHVIAESKVNDSALLDLSALELDDSLPVSRLILIEHGAFG